MRISTDIHIKSPNNDTSKNPFTWSKIIYKNLAVVLQECVLVHTCMDKAYHFKPIGMQLRESSVYQSFPLDNAPT